MRIGIILDIDGTLWDSSKEVAESWTKVFRRHPEYQVDCTRENFIKNMGKPMDEFAAFFLPDVAPEERAPVFKECEVYENEYLLEHRPTPFEGTKEVIEKLADSYQVFIVSNCQKGYIETFMEICGVKDAITDWRCFGDNEMPKEGNIRLLADKYHLERFFYVGDIEGDYRSTVKAHGEFIHAAYGFGKVDADVPRIHDIRELPVLMEKIADAASGEI